MKTALVEPPFYDMAKLAPLMALPVLMTKLSPPPRRRRIRTRWWWW
jgi:hypothetical protein